LQGCPKPANRSQPLVGQSSPYCGDVWRRYRCVTSFFPIVDTCLRCKDIARQLVSWSLTSLFSTNMAISETRYSPTKLWDGAQMAIFCVIFALRPVFSASHVQHISDLHSKFALRPHHVWKYGRHPISDR